MTDMQIFEPEQRAIPYATVGNGPAVVLIAGQGMNPSYLEMLAGSVAAEDFQIVRVGSRRPQGDTAATVSMQDLAQDVIDVMDHLGLADAWVGGHGFGGSIARAVSVEHTDRVNGVLLLGVEAPTFDSDVLDFSGIPEQLRDADVDSLQRAARAAAGAPSPLAPGVPVLVIQGAEDTVLPAANGDALQVSAPDRVSVVNVEGGGYLFPATHVVATSWAIEDYLDWD